jgi:replicative DNA helicase
MKAKKQDFTPPQDIEAEKAIISELINTPKKLYEVPANFTAEMFYKDEHRHVFEAIAELGDKTDLLTVAAKLKNNGTLDACGGQFGIVTLAESNRLITQIEQHCQIVIEKYVQREIIRVSNEAIKSVQELEQTASDMLNHTSDKIYKLSQRLVGNAQKTFPEVVDQAAQEVIDLGLGKVKPGVFTPFKGLNNMIGGFQNGKVYIVAGRPGMGKTSFAANCAIHAANENIPSLMISLEMPEIEIAKRMFALVNESLNGSIMFNKGPQTEPQIDSVFHARDKLKQMAIYLQSEYSSFQSIRGKIKMHVMAKGVRLVVIDYLQLIPPITKKGTKEQEVSEISREVKKLAMELNIPIILLSQLSRNCESRSNKRPILSDLRDSGAIEQDADAVMFLYRDSVYSGDDSDTSAEIILAKSRNGKIGFIECTFVAHRMLYIDNFEPYKPNFTNSDNLPFEDENEPPIF